MAYKKLAMLLLIVLGSVGCSGKEPIAEVIEVQEVIAYEDEMASDAYDIPDYEQITEEMLKAFFESYFGLSLENILVLNQDLLTLETEQKILYAETLEILEAELQPYLGEEIAQKVVKGYLGEKFHLPKILEINNYVTIGESEVEDIAIKSARLLGENRVYEVKVTTKEQVIDCIEANNRYVWDEKIKYYRLRQENESVAKGFGSGYNLEKDLKNSYLFLQETPEETQDAVRLVHHYWVEVSPGEGLKVENIEEANPIRAQEGYRQKASSNKYITRLPYEDEVNKEREEQIKQVIITFLGQPRDFFEYYSKVLYTDYESVVDFFETMGILEQIIIPEYSYKNAYNVQINPYKDNIEKIAIDETKIMCTPSVFGTEKQPRYNIIMPISALTKENEIVYYQYEYLVGMEQEKIEFIHFTLMKEISLEEYEGFSIE